MEYVRGVYRLKKRDVDGYSVIVQFDGKEFWLPGWERSLSLTDNESERGRSDRIFADEIGELIWEDDGK